MNLPLMSLSNVIIYIYIHIFIYYILYIVHLIVIMCIFYGTSMSPILTHIYTHTYTLEYTMHIQTITHSTACDYISIFTFDKIFVLYSILIYANRIFCKMQDIVEIRCLIFSLSFEWLYCVACLIIRDYNLKTNWKR